MSASMFFLDPHGDHHSLDKAPAGNHRETVTFSTLMLGSTLLGSTMVQLLPRRIETPRMSPLHQAVNSGYLLP